MQGQNRQVPMGEQQINIAQFEQMTPEQQAIANRQILEMQIARLESDAYTERMEQASMAREFFLKGALEAAGQRYASLIRNGEKGHSVTDHQLKWILEEGAHIYQQTQEWMLAHQAIGERAEILMTMKDQLANAEQPGADTDEL